MFGEREGGGLVARLGQGEGMFFCFLFVPAFVFFFLASSAIASSETKWLTRCKWPGWQCIVEYVEVTVYYGFS